MNFIFYVCFFLNATVVIGATDPNNVDNKAALVVLTEEAGHEHSEEPPKEKGRTGHALYFAHHQGLRPCCDHDTYKNVKAAIQGRLKDTDGLERFLRQFRHEPRITPFHEASALLATYSHLQKRKALSVRLQQILWANVAALEAHLATGLNFYGREGRKGTDFTKEGSLVSLGKKGTVHYDTDGAVQNACFAAWQAMTLGWRYQTADNDPLVSWNYWLKDHFLAAYRGELQPKDVFPNHKGLRNVIACLQVNIQESHWPVYREPAFRKKSLKKEGA